jgi:hypothetical protein
MQGTSGRIVLGFIAAALAVLIAHEGIIYLLTVSGYLPGPNRAWSMAVKVPPYGVPRLVNNVFWGGLWGVLFALVYDRVPGGMAWLKGLLFGLFMVVVSNWILVPLIKGQVFGVTSPPQVLFANFDPRRMLFTVLIVGSFGLALGIIYGLMRPRTAD